MKTSSTSVNFSSCKSLEEWSEMVALGRATETYSIGMYGFSVEGTANELIEKISESISLSKRNEDQIYMDLKNGVYIWNSTGGSWHTSSSNSEWN